MIDKEKLQEYLEVYKEDFYPYIWKEKDEETGTPFEGERFKWVAVRTFRDNWNIEAEDFPGMLKDSLSATGKLLDGSQPYPKDAIIKLAVKVPEEVRDMFRKLFDEESGEDVINRIFDFKRRSENLFEQYGDKSKKHSQDEHAISVYLWLHEPDKYYIYKFKEVERASTAFDNSDYIFTKGAYEDNLRNFFAFYDEICECVSADEELTSFLQERLAIENLSDERWSDLSCHTLTIDVGFHIANYYSKGEAVIDKYEYIFPLDGYSPNLTVSVWEELLHNPDVFTDKSLLVMKYIKDYGGHATCKQLSLKYGEDPMFYNSHSINLAKRICKVKNIKPDFNGDGSPCYWPVLYVGRYTHTGEDGDFVWKLRDELAEALDNMDKSQTVSIADKAENPIAKAENVKKYSKEDFLNDVFMNEKKYDTLVAVLRNKKNIILQGAPGVGKTYAARRLAYSIMGEEDKERVQLVQFHQNYSYEDFIMGYKPTEDGGFELRSGVFYRFCQKASNQPEKEFFFIIDEINRGNMSKIFGELLMLIEKDYRGERMTLGHEGKTLLVPENLYIIGMMNTADRSLAMIDYALRRRFSFVEMEPAFDSEGFRRYQESLNNETFNRLIEEIVELNGKITEDKSLGKGFCIGHSYFCNWDECTKEKMQEVVDFDIIPTLEEYWFDEPDEVQKWGDILHGVVR